MKTDTDNRPIFRLAPLEWQCQRTGPGMGGSIYRAETILGTYTIESAKYRSVLFDEKRDGQWSFCFDDRGDEGVFPITSIAMGKAQAEEHYRKRMQPALDEVPTAACV